MLAKFLGKEDGLGSGLVLMSLSNVGPWELATPEKLRAMPR